MSYGVHQTLCGQSIPVQHLIDEGQMYVPCWRCHQAERAESERKEQEAALRWQMELMREALLKLIGSLPESVLDEYGEVRHRRDKALALLYPEDA